MAAGHRHPVGGAGQRIHAAADPGGPGPARLPGLAGPVARSARPGRGRARRRGPAVGPAWLPSPGDPAARGRASDQRPAWRASSQLHRCPAGAARCRPLHRGRGGQLRLRPAAPGTGHQCPPGARPDAGRPAMAGPGHHGGRGGAGPVAAAGPAGTGGPVVGRRHGTGRPGVLRCPATLRQLPGGGQLRLAAGRQPGRPGPPGRAALSGHRPAVPWAAAGCAAGFGRAGGRGPVRYRLARPRSARPRAGQPDRRWPGHRAAGRQLLTARFPAVIRPPRSSRFRPARAPGSNRPGHARERR